MAGPPPECAIESTLRVTDKIVSQLRQIYQRHVALEKEVEHAAPRGATKPLTPQQRVCVTQDAPANNFFCISRTL